MAIANLSRAIGMRGTKASIEALAGTLEEQAIAYAVDSGELGIFTNGAWVWVGGPAGQYRQFAWVSDGSGGWEFVSADGEPVLHLEDLE